MGRSVSIVAVIAGIYFLLQVGTVTLQADKALTRWPAVNGTLISREVRVYQVAPQSMRARGRTSFFALEEHFLIHSSRGALPVVARDYASCFPWFTRWMRSKREHELPLGAAVTLHLSPDAPQTAITFTHLKDLWKGPLLLDIVGLILSVGWLVFVEIRDLIEEF